MADHQRSDLRLSKDAERLLGRLRSNRHIQLDGSSGPDASVSDSGFDDISTMDSSAILPVKGPFDRRRRRRMLLDSTPTKEPLSTVECSPEASRLTQEVLSDPLTENPVSERQSHQTLESQSSPASKVPLESQPENSDSADVLLKNLASLEPAAGNPAGNPEAAPNKVVGILQTPTQAGTKHRRRRIVETTPFTCDCVHHAALEYDGFVISRCGHHVRWNCIWRWADEAPAWPPPTLPCGCDMGFMASLRFYYSLGRAWEAGKGVPGVEHGAWRHEVEKLESW